MRSKRTSTTVAMWWSVVFLFHFVFFIFLPQEEPVILIPTHQLCNNRSTLNWNNIFKFLSWLKEMTRFMVSNYNREHHFSCQMNQFGYYRKFDVIKEICFFFAMLWNLSAVYLFSVSNSRRICFLLYLNYMWGESSSSISWFKKLLICM